MCEAFYESIEMFQADLDIWSHPLIEETVNNKLFLRLSPDPGTCSDQCTG